MVISVRRNHWDKLNETCLRLLYTIFVTSYAPLIISKYKVTADPRTVLCYCCAPLSELSLSLLGLQ